ncbi:hypothetical protein FQN50_007677 [Emmonsiellopsis sp. PD_5]|nr:hypothetical protein FQN50_007677 [Emmonsiellopsis sp. PD_5]
MDLDDEWKPDIVVSIDFGMTCTGVSYSFAPEWQPPKTIQHWPGKMVNELANKVPTQLEYDDSGNLKGWGFQCHHEDGDSDIKEYFKLNLAPDYKDDQPGAPSREDAMKWFADYTRCIYQHIVLHFTNTFPQFATSQVEFIYSIPTTWKDPRMCAEIQKCISLDSRNHRAIIGLTEAEAAAIYACKQRYQDINVLKLLSSTGEPTRLEQLDHVEGKPIGSVFIDKSAHQLLSRRLENIRQHLPTSPSDTAWQMMSGRFERFKCSFGSNMTWTVPSLKLDVPTLGPRVNYREAEIYNGQMSISSDEIKQFFDKKIEEMYALIDDQISRVHKRHPGQKISYIVLSGGFGSSPYVRSCLLSRYAGGNASSLQILIADEPQLAVVEGLVMNRIQNLKRGVAAFGSRCCRVSYGVLCDKPYNPKAHVGEAVRYDERDKKTYAENQIDWLIVQGDPIPPTGMTKYFHQKVHPLRVDDPWQVQVVMSTLPPEQLPKSIAYEGAERVCEIDIFTDGAEKKLKNNRWYHRSRPPYYMIKLQVRVVVGAADLRFELWDKHGRRVRSSGNEPIAVKWDPVSAVQNPDDSNKEDTVDDGGEYHLVGS